MSTELAEIAGRVTLHERGLTIETDLPFNEWRRLGQQLVQTSDRALWSLGDWWLYGERFAKDYYEALRELEASSRLIRAGARVARAYTPDRRRGQVSFWLHAAVAGADLPEQDRWLDEAERQGWTHEQLTFAFFQSVERVPVAAITMRASGPLHDLLVSEADRRDMDPKALYPLALERGLREMASESLIEAVA